MIASSLSTNSPADNKRKKSILNAMINIYVGSGPGKEQEEDRGPRQDRGSPAGVDGGGGDRPPLERGQG